MQNKISIITIMTILTACSSNISKTWESCRKVDSELGCVSISDADKAASNFDKEQDFQNIENTGSKEYSSFNSEDIGGNQHLTRTSDQIGRLWIAPYLDKNNNYHEESFVRIIDKTSSWQIRNIESFTQWKK